MVWNVTIRNLHPLPNGIIITMKVETLFCFVKKICCFNCFAQLIVRAETDVVKIFHPFRHPMLNGGRKRFLEKCDRIQWISDSATNSRNGKNCLWTRERRTQDKKVTVNHSSNDKGLKSKGNCTLPIWDAGWNTRCQWPGKMSHSTKPAREKASDNSSSF